jgi:hypothetical protein
LEIGERPVVQIPVMNRGNIHCRPEGQASVHDAKGTVVAWGTLQRGMPAVPGRVERFLVPVSGAPLGPGRYQLQASLTCQSVAQLPSQFTGAQTGELDDAGHWQPITTR